MKPVTPKNIGERTFRIPLYQRPYAWEEPQVQQLLNDLYQASKADNQSDYYLGILSMAKTPEDGNCFDLIDGQQRMTTLFLIGSVAKIYCAEWKEFLKVGRLIFYGREEDKEFLDFLDRIDFTSLESIDNNPYNGNCNRKLVSTIEIAKKFFGEKQFVDREQIRIEKIDKEQFARYIYEHAAFFLAEMPMSYTIMDKNQQFVRMNNRGKQLEKHEILKVWLISKLPHDQRSIRFNDWNYMVKCLTGVENKENGESLALDKILESGGTEEEPKQEEVLSRAMVTIPEFLLIALARFLKSRDVSPNKDKLLETFKILYQDIDGISKFMNILKKQVEILTSFFIFRSQDRNYDLGGRAGGEKKDAFAYGEHTKTEEKKRIIAVQSYLFVSTEPHHWLHEAFDYIEDKGKNEICTEPFIRELERIDNNLTRDNKRNLSPSSPPVLADMTYGNISYYWFYRLDYELFKLYLLSVKCKDTEIAANPYLLLEEKQVVNNFSKLSSDAKTIVKEFRFRQGSSIEHINPQKSMGGAASEEKPDHSFGNLALISRSSNSRFSNFPRPAKWELILKSYAESLKMVYFLCCENDSKFASQTMHKILVNALNDY